MPCSMLTLEPVPTPDRRSSQLLARTFLPFALCLLLAGACGNPDGAGAPGPPPERVAGGAGAAASSCDVDAEGVELELLGHVNLRYPDDEGVPLGGLSGLAWRGGGVYYAVSDDPGELGPYRFYRLQVDPSQGIVEERHVEIAGWTPLRDERGDPLPPHTFDLEAMATGPEGSLFVASEGFADEDVAPAIAEVAADGGLVRRLPVPERYLPDVAGRRGVRDNLGFEGLSVTPAGDRLVVGLENALVQDGPAAAPGVPSPVRLLWYGLPAGEPTAEQAYVTDPVPAEPRARGAFATSGLVELLALGDDHLLVLERSYVAGVGNGARLYLACVHDAADVSGIDVLDQDGDGEPDGVASAAKHLVADLAELGVPLDNLEGMALGPPLADGRHLLLLVSDDNFDAEAQVTQLLALAVSGLPL